jgi:hypothetical protein
MRAIAEPHTETDAYILEARRLAVDPGSAPLEGIRVKEV